MTVAVKVIDPKKGQYITYSKLTGPHIKEILKLRKDGKNAADIATVFITRPSKISRSVIEEVFRKHTGEIKFRAFPTWKPLKKGGSE